jgi:hypothetical protein
MVALKGQGVIRRHRGMEMVTMRHCVARHRRSMGGADSSGEKRPLLENPCGLSD